MGPEGPGRGPGVGRLGVKERRGGLRLRGCGRHFPVARAPVAVRMSPGHSSPLGAAHLTS